ncbi:hypothetical protein SAMN04489867_2921 [Pedococcus dokdonensis]|uniref:DUF5926 domain-containing protein n=1 Tax=Pedococcus dokdonensis TaxID=443156 RepID=A0A1H0TPN9_9MICO|nr:DUF5926 family protein [Pedococcus dokdonensis]SDP55969.1 hypothetical protein SAMN04489867_2921 [Pedococcus dokdonensis]
MGKASRRRKGADSGSVSARVAPAPFVARPFEGLPGETDWVAMREILPSATATVTFAKGQAPEGAPAEVTIATVLPMAWPGLHRADGTVFVGTQSGSVSGDASRDLATSLLAAASAEQGTPITGTPASTADTPRLQDLLDTTAPFEVAVHDGFEFWVGESELDEEAQASLERANESVIPTVKMAATDSAYWCRIGDRTHIRLVLPQDEDVATDALARLHSAGDSGLGDQTRLLGAFRACGLLVPVWDLDPERTADDYEGALGEFMTRYAAASAADAPLTADERRARSGLLSRQVTLR